MTGMILTILLVMLAAQASEPVPEALVYVASSTGQPDSPESPPVGVEGTDPNPGAITNYKCVAYDNGCPAATGFITGSGNWKGCTATCSGSCTRCSGSVYAAQLCKKSAGDTCSISNTTVNCGTKGTASCGTSSTLGGDPDNNGCYCGTPPSYPGGTCNVRICASVT